MKGSVFRRGSTWTARVELPRALDGTRRTTSKGGHAMKRDAQRWLRDTIRRVESGDDPTAGKMRVSELADRWLGTKKVEGLSPDTIQAYRSMLDVWILPVVGAAPVAAVTASHIQDLVAAVLEAGRSPRTAEYVRVTASSMFAAAVEWGITARSPVVGVKRVRQHQRDKAAWTAHETTSFLAYVAGDRWEALWRLAVDSAARRSELVRLAVDDIDGTRLHVRRGKTTAARRFVPLLDSTAAAVARFRRGVAEERLLRGARWTDSGRLIVWPDGRPVSEDWVTRTFAKLVAAAGVRPITFHQLRHSWATQALERGVPMAVVQARLGHSSIQVTGDLYTAVPDDVAESATKRVGGEWG